MSIAYGIDVKTANDPWVGIAEDAVNSLANALIPGVFLVVSMLQLLFVDFSFVQSLKIGFTSVLEICTFVDARSWIQTKGEKVERIRNSPCQCAFCGCQTDHG
jgi:hypothetical protein